MKIQEAWVAYPAEMHAETVEERGVLDNEEDNIKGPLDTIEHADDEAPEESQELALTTSGMLKWGFRKFTMNNAQNNSLIIH